MTFQRRHLPAHSPSTGFSHPSDECDYINVMDSNASVYRDKFADANALAPCEPVLKDISFLAHLMFYQMCYCCRKLDFQWNLNIFNESASNVQLSDWLRDRIHTFEADFLYIWGRFNLFFHVICLGQSDSCTFEADFLYIWGRFSVHLRPIFCTFEANFSKAAR